MEAITLWEPWASLWCVGVKLHETRSWATSYRGPLAVHAASKWSMDLLEDTIWLWPLLVRDPRLAERFGPCVRDGARGKGRRLPRPPYLGCVVGTVSLDDCRRTEETQPRDEDDELAGNWGPGRYAWRASAPVLLDKPIATSGAQGLWRLSPPVLAMLDWSVCEARPVASRS